MLKNRPRLAIFLAISLFASPLFAETSTKIEDRDTSGYRVNVDKFGSKYGLVTANVPIPTSTASSQVSCTSSSGTLAASNSDRVIASWKNTGVTVVFVCMAATCTAGTGMEFNENEGYVAEHYTGALSCITSSGTAVLGFYEN